MINHQVVMDDIVNAIEISNKLSRNTFFILMEIEIPCFFISGGFGSVANGTGKVVFLSTVVE